MRRTSIALLLLVASVGSLSAQVRVGRDSSTRLNRFGRDVVYGTAEGLAFAGYDQWQNDPPEWGGGWSGYGKRAASNIGEFLIQEGVTEGIAAALKRPLDYMPCPCSGTGERIGWALNGILTDPLPSGTRVFAVEKVVGVYAGSFAQAGWRPSHGQDRTRVALLNGTTSLAIGGLINLYHEFNRDVTKQVKRVR